MSKAKSSGRPTLEDVAVVAGVSRATVSRVVNQKPNVSEAIRDSVEQAIAQLNYVPNRAARSLVTKRSDAIGLVVRESEAGIYRDPFLGGLVRDVSDQLARSGLQLVLLIAPDDESLARVIRFLGSRPVDGIILVSFQPGDDVREEFTDLEIPMVKYGPPTIAGSMSYIDSNSFCGGELAVEHLVSQGCTRIGIVTGPMSSFAAVERFAGYRSGLEAAGLEYDDTRVIVGDYTVATGEVVAETLLQRAPDIDAIFASSDSTALGIIKTLRRLSIRVPGDIAVVGFDDIPLAELIEPPLTTIVQPLREMSIGLVQMLLAELEDPGLPKREVIEDVSIVIRGSTLRRAD